MIEVLIRDLGGAPMFDPNFNLNVEDPIDKLLKFQNMGFNPFFSIYTSANPKSPDEYSLRVCVKILQSIRLLPKES